MGVRKSEMGDGGSEVSSVQAFEDLVVWQESQNLAVDVYKATKSFPKDEIFGITNQIRRAASSVSANIAEGYGRSKTNDKLHFMSIAYGSLLETKNFIYLANRLEYLTKDTFNSLIDQSVRCQKLLNGFRRSLKNAQ